MTAKVVVGLLAVVMGGMSGCMVEQSRTPKGQTLSDIGGSWGGGARGMRRPSGAGPGGLRGLMGGDGVGLQGVIGSTAGGGVSGSATGQTGEQAGGASLVLSDAQGNRTLIIQTGQQLMHHLLGAIAEDDAELFVEQILSEVTREEFRDRGRDPAEAFRFIADNETELLKLYNMLPYGEHTPGVVPRSVGSGVLRVELPRSLQTGMFWTGFDMRFEGGQWRLRWFTERKR